jgi:hypothetical protein
MRGFEELIFDYKPAGPEYPSKGQLFLEMLDFE